MELVIYNKLVKTYANECFLYKVHFRDFPSQQNRNGVGYLYGHSAVVKMLRLSFSQLYRHPKVGTGPVDIRSARSKGVFLDRQPFNAISAPSIAHRDFCITPVMTMKL